MLSNESSKHLLKVHLACYSKLFKTFCLLTSLHFLFFFIFHFFIYCRDGLETEWPELISFFSTCDILLFSEVPHQAKVHHTKKRFNQLKDRLNNQLSLMGDKHNKWTLSISEPSGSSVLDKSMEVHLCLTKIPLLTPIRCQTLLALPLHSSGSGRMCHAPFVCLIEPMDRTLPKIVVTSVHMPPKTKKKKRDEQIHKLLQHYVSPTTKRNQHNNNKRNKKENNKDNKKDLEKPYKHLYHFYD